MNDQVSFFLNGRQVVVKDPSPDLLLIDYLRSPEVGLAGPKKPCGEGGCGGCTVILSHWNGETDQAEHVAINSCLRPVLALNGLVVTTVEGTGSARRPNPSHLGASSVFGRSGANIEQAQPPGMIQAQHEVSEKREAVLASASQAACNQQGGCGGPGLTVKLRDDMAATPTEHSNEGINPVAWRLAMNNGSQCGYCTVGFVMNMSEFLANHPNATKRDIEGALDGNICRCTGYRSILTGMKTFASDWTEKDEAERMICLPDQDALSQRPTDYLVIPYPPEACQPASGVTSRYGHETWFSPTNLEELVKLMRTHVAHKTRLVGANTSFGVYKSQYLDAKVRIDVRYVAELNSAPVIGAESLRVPAGITYNDLLTLLEKVMKDRGEMVPGPDGEEVVSDTTRLGALHFMVRRTAGRIVRNAATLAGNTMLMLDHIHGTKLAPFPSDMTTAMIAAEVEIEYVNAHQTGALVIHRTTLAELTAQVVAHGQLAEHLILVAYHLPYGPKNEVLYPEKVALREVNAHSIVNATLRLRLNDSLVVEDVALVYGGIAAQPWRASQTEQALLGQPLALADMARVATILEQEVRAQLVLVEPRMALVPDEGFSDGYRNQLCVSFLYKAVVHCLTVKGGQVPGSVRSAGVITWGRWPVSGGQQFYAKELWKRPVAMPYIKHLAMEQASGQIHYTHELPVPPSTVNASFVQSQRALASWCFHLPGQTKASSVSEMRRFLKSHDASFVDLITYEEFKNGGINLMGMGMDQPIFAIQGQAVQYVGQSLALVCAMGETEAINLAEFVSAHCVGYGPVVQMPGEPDWWSQPVLSLDKAIAVNSIYPDYPTSAPYNSHVWKVIRPGSRFDWADPDLDPLDKRIFSRPGRVGGVPCQVVGNTQVVGGQIHFYMERQAVVVEPSDGRRFMIRPSTQSPMEMHVTASMALGVQYNQIQVKVPYVGGGYGGKTEQTKFVVGAATVAANAMKRPVRLVMTREQDSAMIGKRHGYYGQVQIAIDRGELYPEDKGIIHGMWNKMWGDGGAFYDCSFIVSNCIQTRSDNAYKVQNFQNQIDVCRTNTAPSTAFRSFGDIQCKILTENAIDDAAYSIGMCAEAVREKNLYVQGDVTPFGQALTSCYMRDVWSYLKEKSQYERKVEEVQAFNDANTWRKRGLAMVPVKYGSGYNLAMLEQAAAFLTIYQGDGTAVIHQCGVEMGQGLVTMVRQIAAYVLNLPMEMIQVETPNTSIVPNPTSTGGSTGTQYNGEAVKRLCQDMRTRLTAFVEELLLEKGEVWCKAAGIDYWNYPKDGWRTTIELNGRAVMIWQNIIALAYQYRVPLVGSFNAAIAGGDVPTPVLYYKSLADQPQIPGYTVSATGVPGEFDNFVGFTYSAACSVVEVDILTGEVKVLSADLVYDMGWSLNPALDIGQVEGAFVQGIGYLLSEKLVFEPEGDAAGTLNTLNTWTYKPPAITSIPLEMNTYLFPRDQTTAPILPNDGIFSAKEVGEPPLVLASTVFFATKAAIRASRLERGLDGFFRLNAPATVQEVQGACEVQPEQLSQPSFPKVKGFCTKDEPAK